MENNAVVSIRGNNGLALSIVIMDIIIEEYHLLGYDSV
jgi:hypothetical protein